MTIKTRIDVDAVYHDVTGTSITVGTLSDHIAGTPSAAVSSTGTVGTAAVSLAGATSLSTLVIKNTGTGVLRLAGSVDVTAGRVAVLPTTATITVSSPGGNGSYSMIWIG